MESFNSFTIMKDVFLTLPYPNKAIRNPTHEQVENALTGTPWNHGVVGEVWLILSDADDRDFYRKLWYYLKSKNELIAFFDRDKNSDWMVTIGDAERDKEILVEDDGGRDWKLNEQFLVPIERGIEYALELLRTGDIRTDVGWIVLPEA